MRQSSLDAFTRGDYETAYNGFSELLVTYPKDPLYKYYSGVCLVKLKRDPGQALSLLRQSMQGAAVGRAVPSDALFWLGRAQQMSGNFADAISTYNEFTEQSGKKAAKDLDVQIFIQECNDKKGQITNLEIMPVAQDKNIPVKEALPADYERKLSEALEFQTKADSLNRIIEYQKKNLAKPENKRGTELKSGIAGAEILAASYQKQADQKYNEAEAILNDTSSVEGKTVKRDTPSINESSERRSKIVRDPVAEMKNLFKQDTIKAGQAPVQQKEAVRMPDKQIPADTEAKTGIKKEIATAEKKPAEVFSWFKVIAKPVYGANEEVSINPEVPPGLIYRIQVAVFRNAVAPSYFKGITPVYGFRAAGTDRTNYYVGMFRRRADANKSLTVVKQKGFKDAFIVSFSGSKIVSSERAAVLEKEWSKKPFVAETAGRIESPADTIPPALSFRVEVIRSIKPAKDDVLEGLKKLAGSRGLDTETLKDGTVVYLIGKFITFESAEAYADLLTRNGYREAKVSAWLGKKEIPVETARQLFDKLE